MRKHYNITLGKELGDRLQVVTERDGLSMFKISVTTLVKIVLLKWLLKYEAETVEKLSQEVLGETIRE